MHIITKNSFKRHKTVFLIKNDVHHLSICLNKIKYMFYNFFPANIKFVFKTWLYVHKIYKKIEHDKKILFFFFQFHFKKDTYF